MWNDTDRDGIQDSGESGLDGVTVKLLNGSGTVLNTTTTGSGGQYAFTGLDAGTYEIEFVKPTNYTISPKDQGGNDALDSDANPTTGQTGTFAVSSGQAITNIDAGMWVPPTVSFEVVSVFAGEGAGTATINVVLSHASTDTVTVGYATSDITALAGSDYTAETDTVTFTPGQTSKPITINLTNDSAIEADEAFRITLSNPTNAALGSPNPAKVVILDDEGIITDQPDNVGTEFWLTFPTNYPNPGWQATYPQTIRLFITGETATSGVVEVPGLDFSQPFTVTPGGVSTIDLPLEVDLGLSSDEVLDLGVRVSAAEEVAVYGINRMQHTTDAFLGLPTDVIGTEYIVLSYSNLTFAGDPLPGDLSTNFAFVAGIDGTVVTITPSADTPGHPAGVPYNVTLDRGDVYQLIHSSAGGDLSGTVVTSTHPIGVFGGHALAFIPDGEAAGDHLVEQLLPTQSWGKQFYTAPLATRLNGDTFRVMASEDATVVSINGTIAATLDRGEVYEQILTEASEIIASAPVLVAQYSNGSTFDGVPSDPFMVLIPPAEQFLDRYTVTTPPSGFGQNFVNVVVPTEGVGAIRRNGEAIPAELFEEIGDSGYWWAQVPLETRAHRLSGTVPFGITMYGFDVFDSYGYPGGLKLAPINAESISITATAPDTRFPTGSTVLVTGKVISTEPVMRVTVNGVPVEALDAAGNFFTRVTVSAGDNVFRFVGESVSGLTAETTLTLNGYHPDGIRFDSLSDTSASLKGEYFRTAFDEQTRVLFADLAIRNTGTYKVGTPLLIGVRNMSTPLVDVFEPDGVTPDGTPYWDFSSLVPGTDLDPAELTGLKTITFSNPTRVPFTYDLVVLGQLNRAPVVDTVPDVAHDTGSDYTYDVDAHDPDRHPIISYTLAGGPEGMTIDDETGEITWDELDLELGTFAIVVEVRDDHGGIGVQQFTLELTEEPPNRPPAFNKPPVVTGFINTPYVYELSATDPDGDALTFVLVDGPDGMTYDPVERELLWTPSGSQFGVPHAVVVTVSDGQVEAEQAFAVVLGPEPGNHAPSITTQPSGTAVTNGQTFSYDVNAIDPDTDPEDVLTYRLLGTNLPGNLNINSSTGEITWPVTTFVEPIKFTVEVDDDRGGRPPAGDAHLRAFGQRVDRRDRVQRPQRQRRPRRR